MIADGKFAMKAGLARRAAGAGLAVALSLLLAACLLMPGKFTSSLDLRKDGRFSFAYKGEIYFVSPQDLDDKKEGGAKSGGKDKEAEAAQMAAMTGALDLTDPKKAAEFAAKLEKQHGWRSVKSMGKGRFEVDYAISGTLTHDFSFPLIDELPAANPFVQVILRSDGSARIKAPAFTTGPAGSPLVGLARMGAMEGSEKDGGPKAPELPKMDGLFTLTTDGNILANNTDEGPQAVANGSQLSWVVNESTDHEPTALVSLSR